MQISNSPIQSIYNFLMLLMECILQFELILRVSPSERITKISEKSVNMGPARGWRGRVAASLNVISHGNYTSFLICYGKHWYIRQNQISL